SRTPLPREDDAEHRDEEEDDADDDARVHAMGRDPSRVAVVRAEAVAARAVLHVDAERLERAGETLRERLIEEHVVLQQRLSAGALERQATHAEEDHV